MTQRNGDELEGKAERVSGKGTLGPHQEVETSKNGGGVGGWAPVSRVLQD